MKRRLGRNGGVRTNEGVKETVTKLVRVQTERIQLARWGDEDDFDTGGERAMAAQKSDCAKDIATTCPRSMYAQGRLMFLRFAGEESGSGEIPVESRAHSHSARRKTVNGPAVHAHSCSLHHHRSVVAQTYVHASLNREVLSSHCFVE